MSLLPGSIVVVALLAGIACLCIVVAEALRTPWVAIVLYGIVCLGVQGLWVLRLIATPPAGGHLVLGDGAFLASFLMWTFLAARLRARHGGVALPLLALLGAALNYILLLVFLG